MNKTLAAIVLLCFAQGPARVASGADIRLADDAPQPLAPEECAKRFQLPPGFRIELVASEPDVLEPTALAFDARGRMIVCELHGYNLDGYYDIQELNKTGKLDMQVRRIPASPEAIAKAEKDTYGTVKLLEDTDGDGRADRVHVWADRLPPCYGVVAAGDGVLVACAPDIYFLADRDGDGRAEVRERWFTGFGVGELWTRISNPQWGVDNWIYVASGAGSAGTIHGERMPQPVKLGNTGFRIKPDGSALEPVSAGTSGFGLALSDWDDRFLVTNQQHILYVVPLHHQYLARNPDYAGPPTLENICSYGHPARVFPTSEPDPWRRKRGSQPEWVKFYGSNETSSGLVTSACAPLIYRADQFPVAYRGNHFSCEPAQNLIHRCLLEPRGAGFVAKRASEDREFLTSTDQWFRPVNLTIGPEGAMYIVDMYREIIEDYSAIPRYLQQQYGLIRGHDRGRIWRMFHEGSAVSRGKPLDSASCADLVRELSSGNAWRRLTAQRLLIERRDQAAVPMLIRLVRGGELPTSRLHALYTLAGLGALPPPLLKAALADSHFAVRLHVLRLADVPVKTSDELQEAVLSMLDDPHPQVRLQLAFTLGECSGERVLPALAKLASREGQDPWMRAAILSSVAAAPHILASQLLESPEPDGRGRQLLRPLASVVGSRCRDGEIGTFLSSLARSSWFENEQVSEECLQGILEGLRRGRTLQLSSASGQTAVGQLLAHRSTRVRALALELAVRLKLQETRAMHEAFQRAAEEALDETLAVERRQAAIQLVAHAPSPIVLPVAKALLDPHQPGDVQLAAVRALAAADDSQAATLLLDSWKTLTPEIRGAALEAILGRQNRLAAFVSALEANPQLAQSLDGVRRAQLMSNPDASIAARAKRLFAEAENRRLRPETLARFQQAIAGARDSRQGREVYLKHCSKCHRLLGQGQEVGPDLATAKTRADETLLADVLDPNAQISPGYTSYVLVTVNGRIYTGVLAGESATSVTLRWQEGASETVLRKDIDTMMACDQSLMVPDFETQVTPQDVANLIGYLREALGPVPPPGHVLFDEEPGFAELLTEGKGTARVTSGDRFAGALALQVSPPQRFQPRLAGWNFRIAENPQTDEYRYLRFAWKARGTGVMLELAADGQWPPADRALRRYYSGKNSTGWQAVEVSAAIPREWTEVIVDLWKDCGEFTLTGIAPTTMGGDALFDRIELLRTLTP